MLRNVPLVFLLAALALACSPKAAKSPAAPGDGVLTVKQVMRERIEPNAQIYWHSSGSIDTVQGSESLVPTTPEGWKKAADSLDEIMQGARLLKTRPIARDRGDWIKHADALIGQVKLAQAATKARNGDEMFLTGGDMYAACTACHKQYLLPLLGPDGRPKKIDENGSPIVSTPN